MSLFGTMKTAVSGMNAQANRLGTVGDNIANSSTTGYKKASTEFSSLVLPQTKGTYTSGGVTTNVRYAVSEQGNLSYTSSNTDLAISGSGFFVVQDSGGTPYLSRAGSFTIDDNGDLVNAAGYKLLGYSYTGGTPAAVVNGFDGLVPINVTDAQLKAKASTTGTFYANLNADATAVPAASLPSTNSATADYTHKSSLVAYDSLGHEVLYDFYYTKTDTNEWDVTAYRKDQASAAGFPYTATAPASVVTSTVHLTFDPATGTLTSGSDQSISITDPTSGTVPAQTINIDLSGMNQKATDFTTLKASVDGNKANAIKDVSVSKDGTVNAVYDDGSLSPLYRIALATVQSPDNLVLQNGNVYSQSGDSGVVTTGFPGDGNFGDVISGALEDSNVDMASELTEMIEAQRSYTANSKVFQTGSDLMDVLINLKR